MKPVIMPSGLGDSDLSPGNVGTIDLKQKGGVVVLAQREFIRECVGTWLAACCGEHCVPIAGEALLTSPAAILIDASRPGWNSSWIEKQVAAQRSQGAWAPVALLIDPEDADRALDLVTRLDLRGYIPTSDSAEIAAAALHLIIAGGTYIPHYSTADRGFSTTRSSQTSLERAPALQTLTLRERAVLRLLEVGMPNKVIARQLGMSLSTVKIHVHHIIHKLNVQNRTEAVITAARFKALPLEISSNLDFSEIIK